MNFWDVIRDEIKAQGTTQEWVAAKSGISYDTIKGWISKNRLPRLDQAKVIADSLNLSLDAILAGKALHTFVIPVQDYSPNSEAIAIPILDHKVVPGTELDVPGSLKVIGSLPFMRKLLRGALPAEARALEIRGDAMTGLGLFGGDMVVFQPGLVEEDGIYVIQVDMLLLVKRIYFDRIARNIHIMSENERYPDKIEPLDAQAVRLIGRVLAWVHVHQR